MDPKEFKKIKVILICGFLGSGKTTLLKRIADDLPRHGKDVIMVNDFGSINIDKQVLNANGLDIIPLSSGCVCCSLKGNLILTIKKIVAEINPERIFIEASGIASPAQIIGTLKEGTLSTSIDINLTITVLDSFNFIRYKRMLGSFFSQQLEWADVILLNKTDLINNDHKLFIEKSIKELNPNAVIYVTHFCAIPVNALIENKCLKRIESNLDFNQLPFSVETLELDIDDYCFDEVRIIRFFEKLESNDYGTLLRAKGIFRIENSHVLFNMVPGQVKINPVPEATAQVIFLGTDLLKEQLKNDLFACML